MWSPLRIRAFPRMTQQAVQGFQVKSRNGMERCHWTAAVVAPVQMGVQTEHAKLSDRKISVYCLF